jgi:uncharacterized protein
MKKYLITGGSGFIGSKLIEKLSGEKNQITVLTRNKNFKSSGLIKYIRDLDDQKFDYDIVINLQGEPISQRWSKAKKQEIVASRIGITEKIVAKINSSETPPSLFISGSAIGFYGTSADEIFVENSKPTSQNLFSQNLCKNWEAAAMRAKTRVVLIRTSVVIGKNGGIMKKMLMPFKLGLGGKIGNGKQQLSWIHLDDAVNAILFLIENQKIEGAVNLSSPNFVTNLEFSKSLARALNRPCLFTIPALSMKLLYGEMADELLLNGQKTYPQILLEAGFKFEHKNLDQAIKISL